MKSFISCDICSNTAVSKSKQTSLMRTRLSGFFPSNPTYSMCNDGFISHMPHYIYHSHANPKKMDITTISTFEICFKNPDKATVSGGL